MHKRFANLDVAQLKAQRTKWSQNHKSGLSHPTVPGNTVNRRLPKVEKNNCCIRREFLDPEWMGGYASDDSIWLQVHQSDDDEAVNELNELAEREEDTESCRATSELTIWF